MPQPKTIFEAGKIYHIWTHANGYENLFKTNDNYRYFLMKYAQHVHPFVDTYAYCLMPNHLHLMVQIKEEKEILEVIELKKGRKLQGLFSVERVISQQFSNLFNAYTKAYNKMLGRKGCLFMPNFKRKIVDKERYFTKLLAYIHNNPIHHGFVNDINDWLFSSWHAYLSNKNSKLKLNAAKSWFEDIESFKKYHQEVMIEKLEAIFEDT